MDGKARMFCFGLQEKVDKLQADVQGANSTVALRDICYKPFGDECATQSLLQVSQVLVSRHLQHLF